ncbi:MAG: hypothetical protein LBG67_04060 [Campylobacteraceae bacterium]|jgi:hypothetical protein|nr:hypothetical protein [Campylobacteraceae bacterium]
MLRLTEWAKYDKHRFYIDLKCQSGRSTYKVFVEDRADEPQWRLEITGHRGNPHSDEMMMEASIEDTLGEELRDMLRPEYNEEADQYVYYFTKQQALEALRARSKFLFTLKD